MAVSLKFKISKADIKRMLADRQERIVQAVIFRIQRIGEQFVTNARDNGSYTDRTGNLRSSIGYVILVDGKQLSENFEYFPPGDRTKKPKGKSGQSKAKEVIKEIKTNFPRGIVLICVAGMEYAAAVESRGYDVITASSDLAENALKEAIKTIAAKVGTL